MADIERISKFYADVERLGLKFPGTTIAKETGYDKATVSQYLSKKLEPSEAFTKIFYDKFKDSLSQVSNKDVEKESRTPTWQDLLAREEIARKLAEATAAAHEARAEDFKAYNLFLQDMMKSSLAPILSTLLEVREDAKGIVRFEQGMAQYLQASAEIAQRVKSEMGTGNVPKKDAPKKDIRAQ